MWTGLDEHGLTINITRVNSGNGANLGSPEIFQTIAKSLAGWMGVKNRANLVRVNGNRIAIIFPIEPIPGTRAEFQLESMETTLRIAPDPQSSIARELALRLPNKLHLRPAAAIHKIVTSFPGTRLLIRWKEKVADATSVISMTVANIPPTKVSFIAYGKNSRKVLARIKTLVDEADPGIWGSTPATTVDEPPSQTQSTRDSSIKLSLSRRTILNNNFSLKLIVALMKIASLHTDAKLYIGKDEDHLVEVGPSILNLMTMSLRKGSTITLATGENNDVAKTLLGSAIAII